MYIVKADYKTIISTPLLDTIIRESENDDGTDLLQVASKIAEDTIITKAGVLYDIMPEFTKAGADRNFMILSLAISIAGYWLYQRIDDEQVPEKVIKNYNDALTTLEQVSIGKEPLLLPPRNDDDGSTGGGDEGVTTDGTGLRRIGSQPRRTHQM
jgi:hypothetical protein